jgi:transposase
VLKEGISWRALDLADVAWQTVYGYFRRWAVSEFWAKLREEVIGHDFDSDRCVDSTSIKVHKDGANPHGGQANQAIGRSKGGLTTKIHISVDGQGRPVAIEITPGQSGDAPEAIPLLERSGKWSTAIMDKAYDSDEIRDFINGGETEAEACIPPKSNRKTAIAFNKTTYKKRHVVENFFEVLKRVRRVGTRYDKTSASFLALINIWLAMRYGRGHF